MKIHICRIPVPIILQSSRVGRKYLAQASYVYAVDRAGKDESSHTIRFRFGFKLEFVFGDAEELFSARSFEGSYITTNESIIFSTLRITSIRNIRPIREVLILQSEFIKNFVTK